MTDLPYTDDDLRREAALQYNANTEDPDFGGVGEGMQDEEPWNALGEDDFHTAQLAIHDLRRKAAPLGHWAIALGADGLEPDTDAELTIHAGDRPIARVLFAFAPDMDADLRADLVAGLGEAINQHI